MIQVILIKRSHGEMEKRTVDNSAEHRLKLYKSNFNSCLLPESIGKNKRRLRDMLGMEKYIAIKTLRERGYSKTKIAKMLGCGRKTVRKILMELESGKEIVIKKKTTPKMLDIYKDYIMVKVEEELSAVRIYQDLVKEKGYEGSYETVALYVKGLKNVVNVYMRLHSLPGEEAQVDFGYVGRVVCVDGKLKKVWVFSMGLSYSRYRYYEAVFSQDVKTFIQCHINAFKFFGGVPKTVKIDNLKSAILEASFYEPLYQREYLNFAKYYGFAPIPCRIATPTDKGKAESNVKYVKNGFFKGRLFKGSTFEEGLIRCNTELMDWTNNICNKKVHSTIKEVPFDKFNNEEAKTLLSLPTVDYEISEWVVRKVNIDTHINVKLNYYSVPYEYIGKEVKVEIKDKLILIYGDNQLLTTHERCFEKGKFITKNSHYPPYKVITESEYYGYYGNKMWQIGENAKRYYEEMLNRLGYSCYRAVRGIIELAKRYGDYAVDKACKRAIMYDAYGYRIIKSICEKGLYEVEIEEVNCPNKYGRTFERSLRDYDRLFSGEDFSINNN